MSVKPYLLGLVLGAFVGFCAASAISLKVNGFDAFGEGPGKTRTAADWQPGPTYQPGAPLLSGETAGQTRVPITGVTSDNEAVYDFRLPAGATSLRMTIAGTGAIGSVHVEPRFSGPCVDMDASGNIIDRGFPCRP